MAKRKKIWDNYIEIGEVQKTNRIKFVLAAATRDGIRYLNIREFYLRQRDNVWRPGRDGITIPLNYPISLNETTGEINLIKPYSDMIDLFTKAAEIMLSMELADENNAVYAEQLKEDKE